MKSAAEVHELISNCESIDLSMNNVYLYERACFEVNFHEYSETYNQSVIIYSTSSERHVLHLYLKFYKRLYLFYGQ
jgi:hypothetical protein